MVAERKANPRLQELIRELKSKGDGKKGPVWGVVANRLLRARHQVHAVNVGHLERVAAAKEIVVVPSKLLASGKITKPLVVGALAWSDAAAEKIIAAGGELKSLSALAKENPEGKGVRLIG